MSAILAVCGDTFCAMVSDGRYVEEPITGEKPHILKNDLPKVRKINRNVVVGFATRWPPCRSSTQWTSTRPST